jgi:hypothetical protein
MGYSQTGTITAADYNGFASSGANNINAIWSTGSGDKGWGQTAIPAVSISGTVTAPAYWNSLIANLAQAGSQTGTSMTPRTLPVAGATITALSDIQTNIDTVTTNRGNAISSGTEYGTFTGTGVSKTSATSNGTQGTWTITWTQTVTFGSADAARYFWNAGGIVRLKYGKTSGATGGTDIDPDWNSLAGWPGQINLTGRVNSNSQLIAGGTYTGTTRVGGSGGTATTLATTTGWYNLTTSPTTIFKLNSTIYSGEYIQTTAAATSSTVLTLVTTWFQPAVTTAGTTTNISGGTATTSPSTTITGTAPTVLLTYLPPSTAQGLTNTWGTPAIVSNIS